MTNSRLVHSNDASYQLISVVLDNWYRKTSREFDVIEQISISRIFVSDTNHLRTTDELRERFYRLSGEILRHL